MSRPREKGPSVIVGRKGGLIICLCCGRLRPHSARKMCESCYKTASRPKHPCMDCGAPIHIVSKRCHVCAAKATKKPVNRCLECGVKIARKALRCPRCAQDVAQSPGARTTREILRNLTCPEPELVKESTERVGKRLDERARPASSCRPQFMEHEPYQDPKLAENLKVSRVGRLGDHTPALTIGDLAKSGGGGKKH